MGQVLKTLRENGLAENTLVIFTSDNGPWLIRKERAGNAGPLRAGKSSSYEGGSRVPCIVWQPETVPAGVACDLQVSTLDLFPTLAAMAGVGVPTYRPLDGKDVGSVLKGDFEDAPERDWFLYKGEAIRVKDWKYVNSKNKGDELFNLSEDVGERQNLATQYPERLVELRERLRMVKSALEFSK